MFIHYHTKCSHFKIHLNGLLLFCNVFWSLSRKKTVYDLQGVCQNFVHSLPFPQNKIENNKNMEQRKLMQVLLQCHKVMDKKCVGEI